MQAHFSYDSGLCESGILILAGRTTESPYIGVFIFEAEDRKQAEQIVADDPAVVAGLVRTRVQSYRVALARA